MNAINPLGSVGSVGSVGPMGSLPRSRFLILSILAGLILVAVLFIAFYRKTIGPQIQDAWNRITTFFRKDGTAKVSIGPGQSETPVLTATLNPEPTVILPPLTKPLFNENVGGLAPEYESPGSIPSAMGPSAMAATIPVQPTLEYDESIHTAPELPEPVYVPKAGDNPPGDRMGPVENRPAGMPGSLDPLGTIPSSLPANGMDVYNISNNVYTFNDAAAVCAAAGGELATYDQVKAAYERGADWCNYGWIKGQMAVYPTQKETWESLQKGPSEFRNACGRPGINGGYFDNPDLRFGVTCYGPKPARKPGDVLLESQVALPQSAEEIEFQKNVQKFRDQLDSAVILPFRKGQWTA